MPDYRGYEMALKEADDRLAAKDDAIKALTARISELLQEVEILKEQLAEANNGDGLFAEEW